MSRGMAGYRTSTLVTVEKTDAFVTLTQTATWADVPFGGTAAARDLDLVLPGVSVGDWVEVTPSLYVPTNAANGAQLDIAVIVAGEMVHRFGTDGAGISTWGVFTGTRSDITGARRYQVQTGDIEDGSIRLRLIYKNGNGRTIFAGSGYAIRLEGRGPLV